LGTSLCYSFLRHIAISHHTACRLPHATTTVVAKNHCYSTFVAISHSGRSISREACVGCLAASPTEPLNTSFESAVFKDRDSYDLLSSSSSSSSSSLPPPLLLLLLLRVFCLQHVLDSVPALESWRPLHRGPRKAPREPPSPPRGPHSCMRRAPPIRL